MTTIEKIRTEIEEKRNVAGHFDTKTARAQVLALSWVIDLIDKYAEQEAKWISVSERLPEKSTWVLTTCKNSDGYIFLEILLINQYTGLWDGDEDFSGTVIAWMPLPKLYEPQESEDKE